MYEELWDILLDNVCCRGCLEISRGQIQLVKDGQTFRLAAVIFKWATAC